MNYSFVPTGCHLWTEGDPTIDQLIGDLITVKMYEDDSDFIRALKKCKLCEQLFFYEFYERIDWDGGNDPQYRTWVPVQDVENADALSKLSPMDLLDFSGIRSDFPLSARKSSRPRWVVK